MDKITPRADLPVIGWIKSTRYNPLARGMQNRWEPVLIPQYDVSNAKPRAGDKRDKVFGMTAESRQGHAAADKPGLEVRAIQYALAMTGREVPHSSALLRERSVGRVWTGKVQEPGYKRPTKRAAGVRFADGTQYDIPHWDWIEPGIMEGSRRDEAA